MLAQKLRDCVPHWQEFSCHICYFKLMEGSCLCLSLLSLSADLVKQLRCRREPMDPHLFFIYICSLSVLLLGCGIIRHIPIIHFSPLWRSSASLFVRGDLCFFPKHTSFLVFVFLSAKEAFLFLAPLTIHYFTLLFGVSLFLVTFNTQSQGGNYETPHIIIRPHAAGKSIFQYQAVRSFNRESVNRQFKIT